MLHPQAYDAQYYMNTDGQPLSTFNYDPARDTARAQAIADAVDLPPGGRVLDFGCGLGTMTAAFTALGYDAMGVDPSPSAIENALPQARDRVRLLGPGGLSLSDFPNDLVDLVIAKDVFEHIDEDHLHELVDHLVCIGRRVLAVIPTVDEEGSFIFSLYNEDETHVTRLTRRQWLGRFAYESAFDLDTLTPGIRRADKVAGTLCLLLEESDPRWRVTMMRERVRSHTPIWRQMLGLPLREFDPDFALFSSRLRTM